MQQLMAPGRPPRGPAISVSNPEPGVYQFYIQCMAFASQRDFRAYCDEVLGWMLDNFGTQHDKWECVTIGYFTIHDINIAFQFRMRWM